MTTREAAARYEAEHVAMCAGKGWAIYNPNNVPPETLPVIFGFNNGGSGDWWYAQLITEDGYAIGGHCCSSEAYMPYDLGVLEGSRPDRHEGFRKHYPNGYRMEFVRGDQCDTHAGLQSAIARHREGRPETGRVEA